MRNYSRFIPDEEIGAVKQWDFGAVDTEALLLAAQVKSQEEASDQVTHEAIRQEGYAAGHAEGHAQGFAQGQAETRLEAQQQISDFVATQGQEAGQRFAAIFVAAQAQLDAAEQDIARGVLELACELARQVVRQELSVNPKVLQPVIREALDQLGTETKSALVRLNPLDLAALEEGARAELSGLSLTLMADVAVTPGGCLIESAGTVVDGTLEKRWMRTIANLGLNSPWKEPVEKQ